MELLKRLIWPGCSAIGVGLMAWLNIIAIILLRKPALRLRALKDYRDQRKTIENPVFDPEVLGIRDSQVWKALYSDQTNAS